MRAYVLLLVFILGCTQNVDNQSARENHSQKFGNSVEDWKEAFSEPAQSFSFTQSTELCSLHSFKPGDVNRDFKFDSLDLVLVFNRGKYEDKNEDESNPVSWDEGNWNGDLVFDSKDLAEALSIGHFETGYYCRRSVLPSEHADYMLASGQSHACVLHDLGVDCWGKNDRGQTDVPPLVRPRLIAAGLDNTCAVDETGVVCWGANRAINENIPGTLNTPGTLNNPHALALGGGQACAVDQNRAYCWGSGTVHSIPGRIANFENIRTIAVAKNNGCLIADSFLKCWGKDFKGRDHPFDSRPKNPREVSLSDGVMCVVHGEFGFPEVSCAGYNRSAATFNHDVEFARYSDKWSAVTGSTHACAIDRDGVKCWGANTSGQADVAGNTSHPVSLVAEGNYSCALGSSGVSCWGELEKGFERSALEARNHSFCGITTSEHCAEETTTGTDQDIMLSAGNDHTCALKEGQVYCWGDDTDGPSNVPVLTQPKLVEAGFSSSCAIDQFGLTCWGQNKVLRNITDGRVVLNKPAAVAIGSSHMCAIDDGRVRCWGNGKPHGNVPALVRPKAVAAGASFSCAIDAVGARCWHSMESVPDRDLNLSPPEMEEPTAIAAGRTHACAIHEGSVSCWGKPGEEVIVPHGLGKVKAIALSDGTSCALTDTITCWGRGPEMSRRRLSIKNAEAKKVAVGKWHECVLQKDDLVRCFGGHSEGTSVVPSALSGR